MCSSIDNQIRLIEEFDKGEGSWINQPKKLSNLVRIQHNTKTVKVKFSLKKSHVHYDCGLTADIH